MTLNSDSYDNGSSRYHVKVSFQEILAKNSIKGLNEENNRKKEEVSNRKKNKMINDSILGCNMPRERVVGSNEYKDKFSKEK